MTTARYNYTSSVHAVVLCSVEYIIQYSNYKKVVISAQDSDILQIKSYKKS